YQCHYLATSFRASVKKVGSPHGLHLDRWQHSQRTRRASQNFVIPTHTHGMVRPRTFPAGCEGWMATSFKSLRSIALISGVQCAGFRNRTSSCVRVTAALSTKTVRMHRGRRRADSTNTSTKSRTDNYGYTEVSFQH